MAMIKCSECGKEFEDSNKACPECGCPIVQQTGAFLKKSTTKIDSIRRVRRFLLVGAIICFVVSGVFYYRANNVKNDYYNSEDYPILNKNAYVGGDAYNYIINGTYFTGYVTIASDMLLGGIAFVCGAAIISVKIREVEENV